jgi:hypothetical protein
MAGAVSRCGFPWIEMAYHRGRGAKAGTRKRSFCDDGHQTPSSRAPAGKSRSRRQPSITVTITTHSDALLYTTRLLPLDKPFPLNSPSGPWLLSTPPRRRQSHNLHRHKILSIGTVSYKPTLSARHDQKLPAEWPTSPLRRRPNLTNTSPTFPPSLRNHSTTRLPPPWTKRRPFPRRCCLPSLAAS